MRMRTCAARWNKRWSKSIQGGCSRRGRGKRGALARRGSAGTPGVDTVCATNLLARGFFSLDGDFFCVHSAHEKPVIGFALVGVSLGELNDSFIETIALSDIAAQPGGVSVFGMGTREGPTAHVG